MGVVFQTGYSNIEFKEEYSDDAWTDLARAKDFLERSVGSSKIQWELISGGDSVSRWRGKFLKPNAPFVQYVYIKPIVLNAPEYRQKQLLASKNWNKPKLFLSKS